MRTRTRAHTYTHTPDEEEEEEEEEEQEIEEVEAEEEVSCFLEMIGFTTACSTAVDAATSDVVGCDRSCSRPYCDYNKDSCRGNVDMCNVHATWQENTHFTHSYYNLY